MLTHPQPSDPSIAANSADPATSGKCHANPSRGPPSQSFRLPGCRVLSPTWRGAGDSGGGGRPDGRKWCAGLMPMTNGLDANVNVMFIGLVIHQFYLGMSQNYGTILNPTVDAYFVDWTWSFQSFPSCSPHPIAVSPCAHRAAKLDQKPRINNPPDRKPCSSVCTFCPKRVILPQCRVDFWCWEPCKIWGAFFCLFTVITATHAPFSAGSQHSFECISIAKL